MRAAAIASPRKISSDSFSRCTSALTSGAVFMSISPITTAVARARAMVNPRSDLAKVMEAPGCRVLPSLTLACHELGKGFHDPGIKLGPGFVVQFLQHLTVPLGAPITLAAGHDLIGFDQADDAAPHGDGRFHQAEERR